MLELLSVLMCGGGPSPAPTPAPAPAPAPSKQPMRAARQKQGGTRGASQASSGSVGAGTGGTLLTGMQGIGDASLSTGKTILGG